MLQLGGPFLDQKMAILGNFGQFLGNFCPFLVIVFAVGVPGIILVMWGPQKLPFLPVYLLLVFLQFMNFNLCAADYSIVHIFPLCIYIPKALESMMVQTNSYAKFNIQYRQ